MPKKKQRDYSCKVDCLEIKYLPVGDRLFFGGHKIVYALKDAVGTPTL